MAPTRSVSEKLAQARVEAAELGSRLETIGIETRSLVRGPSRDRAVAVGVARNAQRLAIAAVALAGAAATILVIASDAEDGVL